MKLFIMSLDEFVINIPKKDYIIKNRLYDDSLVVLELIYLANNIDNSKRKDLQLQIVSKISMLDFYLEHAYFKRYISQRECLKRSTILNKITKMVYGWINDCNNG